MRARLCAGHRETSLVSSENFRAHSAYGDVHGRRSRFVCSGLILPKSPDDASAAIDQEMRKLADVLSEATRRSQAGSMMSIGRGNRAVVRDNRARAGAGFVLGGTVDRKWLLLSDAVVSSSVAQT